MIEFSPEEWEAVERRFRAAYAREWVLGNTRPLEGQWEARFQDWFELTVRSKAPLFGVTNLPPSFMKESKVVCLP